MPDPLLTRYGGWALITGASAGLGACFAEALARRGFPLVLTARREERLRTLAARLEKEHGVETQVVVLDLAEPAAADALHAAVGEREIGVLVNNAGFGFNGNFIDRDLGYYDRMVQLNCATPVRLTQRILPGMIRRERGAILMLASTAAFQPVPYLSVYAATKAFDLVFGEGLAGELLGTGIDVLNVCPGVTQTEFAQVARLEKSRHGADPMDVVESSLERLGRRLTFVHGLANRTRSLAVRLFPRAVLVRIGARIMPKLLFGKSAAHYRKKLMRQVRQNGDDSGRNERDGAPKQPRE